MYDSWYEWWLGIEIFEIEACLPEGFKHVFIGSLIGYYRTISDTEGFVKASQCFVLSTDNCPAIGRLCFCQNYKM